MLPSGVLELLRRSNRSCLGGEEAEVISSTDLNEQEGDTVAQRRISVQLAAPISQEEEENGLVESTTTDDTATANDGEISLAP